MGQLEAKIEHKKNNNRKNAIQYILLHELGHIASVKENIHPPWNPVVSKDLSVSGNYPFYDLSWKEGADKGRYFPKSEFPLQMDVVYYWGVRLKIKDAKTIYEHLESSGYPTLYGATHFADDFAESYVAYVHTVLMKKPFEINIYKDNKLIKKYESCWGKPRCAEKEKILKNYLNRKID